MVGSLENSCMAVHPRFDVIRKSPDSFHQLPHHQTDLMHTAPNAATNALNLSASPVQHRLLDLDLHTATKGSHLQSPRQKREFEI
ncbi:hypothetical protein RJZ90_004824, partial [Blastomyces dermatitidis]